MAEEISQESQPDKWKTMMSQWLKEGRPGWLVVGNRTFQVKRVSGDRVIFKEAGSGESFYESRSFR